MSYTIQLRRMTPHEAVMAVYGPEIMRGYTLGSMTPKQAADQVMPVVKNVPGFNQGVYNNLLQAATSGNFVSFNPGGCSGITPSGAKIAQTAGGLALTGLNTGLALAAVPIPIAGPIIAGASLLVGLFTSIFAHHAAKVKQEQQIVCASVPAASDSLKAIDQAVQNGTITPSQGITALQALEDNFTQTVQPILKMNSSQCNAACVWIGQLKAIVLKKSSDYQDMQAVQQAAALPPASSSAPASVVTGSSPTPSSVIRVGTITGTLAAPGPANIPVWGWLAIAAGAFLVLRG